MTQNCVMMQICLYVVSVDVLFLVITVNHFRCVLRVLNRYLQIGKKY